MIKLYLTVILIFEQIVSYYILQQKLDIWLYPRLSQFDPKLMYLRNHEESVFVKSEIKGYPDDIVVEKFTFDEDVPKNETASVKFYHNKRDLLWLKYKNYEEEDNAIVPKLNCTYVHIVNCYVNNAASIVTQDGVFSNVEPNKNLMFINPFLQF